MPFAVLVVLAGASFGLTLNWLVGSEALFRVVLTLVTDGAVALLIFASAAGWGWLACRWWLPAQTPRGLRAVTSLGAGLWLLATAVLAIGATFRHALTAAVWWPIVAAGCALLLLAMRGFALRLTPRVRTAGAGNLCWVAVAIACAFWLAGALMPVGAMGRATGDFYDVLSYHLQVPREFYHAGRIEFLPHNSYSNYPLGGEMLFLLAMCLTGGAYAGAFAATLTHGLWGVLAVSAVWLGLAGETVWRRRTAAVLLATVPLGLYLSWLAFVEWTELAYLAIAIAWLNRWHQAPCWRSALAVGLACGGACATKYLSVGLVAGPVLAVMLGAWVVSRVRIRRVCRAPLHGGRHRLAHFLVACAATIALMSPWLVRNAANTGNPVFPLVTQMLGRGHWSQESVRRWDAAHAPPPWQQRMDRLGTAFYADNNNQDFGPAWTLLAVAAAAWAACRGKATAALDWLCLAIWILQLGVFSFATHMPGRFLIPAAVPMAILTGGLASRLAWPPASHPASAGRPVVLPAGSLAALALVSLTVAANLYSAWVAYAEREPFTFQDGIPRGLHGYLPGDVVELTPRLRAMHEVLDGPNRLLLIADVQPFYFPADTLYYSVWEENPLAQIARQTGRDPREIARQLRKRHGITHLWINWSERQRLRSTYGWWEEIDRPLIQALLRSGAEEIPLPEDAADVHGVQFLALPVME